MQQAGADGRLLSMVVTSWRARVLKVNGGQSEKSFSLFTVSGLNGVSAGSSQTGDFLRSYRILGALLENGLRGNLSNHCNPGS